MAQGTSLVLLAQRAYPGPQGTTIAYFGDKQQAAAYILGNRDLQTITWSLGPMPDPQGMNNLPFIGIVTLQASLVTEPTEADWFYIYMIPAQATQRINNTDCQAGHYNLVGNYVWIRAAVSQWTQGTINLVTMSY
jgi:hypothetical protein